MIVGIMQPYFFPYLGYFQLMAACDVFVLHDDVQYIKGGWVNRNRILRNGGASWLTMPVCQGASHLAINRRFYQLEQPIVARLLRRLEAAYRRAIRFDAIFPFIAELLAFGAPNVALFNANLLQQIALRLGIGTRLVSSSALDKTANLTGVDRVLDICRRLGATRYVNPIGGTRLYAAERFAADGVTLRFLQPELPDYPQFGQPFVANLSIIDALMFNDDLVLDRLMGSYRLMPAGSAGAGGHASGPPR